MSHLTHVNDSRLCLHAVEASPRTNIVCCSVLQCVAVYFRCFSVLQCVAVCGDGIYMTNSNVISTYCNTLQHTETSKTHCNTLQHTATHCNTLQRNAAHCNTLQHTATHCNTVCSRGDDSYECHCHDSSICVT